MKEIPYRLHLADLLDNARYRRLTTRSDRLNFSPAVLMREAEKITGLKFKPRDYEGAASALRNLNPDESD